MRIISIKVPKSLCDNYKLAPVDVSKLGKVVVIAGKNGSGKSRFFKLLRALFNDYTHPSNIGNLQRAIKNFEDRIQLVKNGDKNILQGQTVESFISAHEQSIKHSKLLKEWQGGLTLDSNWEEKSLIEFFPKPSDLSDSYVMSKKDISDNGPDAAKVDLNNLGYQTVPIIQYITQNFSIATNLELGKRFKPEEVKEKIDAYNGLNDIIENFWESEH